MYQSHGCLRDMKNKDYKNIPLKKKVKDEIGTHFGLSLRYVYTQRKDTNGKCKIIIKTSLLTTAGSRPAARPHPGRTTGTGSCVARAAHLARMCGLPCAAAPPASVSLALPCPPHIDCGGGIFSTIGRRPPRSQSFVAQLLWKIKNAGLGWHQIGVAAATAW